MNAVNAVKQWRLDAYLPNEYLEFYCDSIPALCLLCAQLRLSAVADWRRTVHACALAVHWPAVHYTLLCTDWRCPDWRCTDWLCTDWRCTDCRCTDWRCTDWRFTDWRCTDWRCTDWRCTDWRCTDTGVCRVSVIGLVTRVMLPRRASMRGGGQPSQGGG